MLRLWVHYLALAIEVVGTIFVSLDLIRIDVIASASGYASSGPEPAKYHGWVWHGGLWGSGLLMLGIIVAGAALLLEHREMVFSRRRPWFW
jgi:hypothetical protein